VSPGTRQSSPDGGSGDPVSTRRNRPQESGSQRDITIFLLLYAAIVVTVAAMSVAPSVPFVLILGVIGIGLCLGSIWHGAILVLLVTMLLPIIFAVRLGGSSFTFGRILLFALTVGWLVNIKRPDRPIRPRRTPLDAPMAVILVGLVTSTVANLPRFNTIELAGAIRKISLFAVDYFLLFWIVVTVLRDEQRLRLFLRILAGAIAFTAALGLVEHFTGRNVFEYVVPVLPRSLGRVVTGVAKGSVLVRGRVSRVHSTFEQPLAFGIVLAMGLPLTTVFGFIESQRRWRVAWAGATLFIASAILFTASRSIYILAAATFVTLVLALPERRLRITAGVAAVGVLALFLAQHDVRETMIQFFQPRRGPQLEASLQHRVEDINPVLARVNHSPIFGYGPRTFAPDELRTSHLLDNPDNLTLDNAYLGELAEGGVVGFLALVLLLMTAYVSGWRAYRRVSEPNAKLTRLGLVLVVQNWILMGFVADIYGFNAPPKLFFALLAALAVTRAEHRSTAQTRYAEAEDRHLLPPI